MNKIKNSEPTHPVHEKHIYDQVMDRATGIVVCCSSHLAGNKKQADVIQEVRSMAADVTVCLNELEGLSHHGREQ